MTWPYIKRKKEINLRFGLWAEIESDDDGNAYMITLHQLVGNREENKEETFVIVDLDKKRIGEWLALLAKETQSSTGSANK